MKESIQQRRNDIRPEEEEIPQLHESVINILFAVYYEFHLDRRGKVR